jgi:ATP-binding cassette, subfamily B, bacterial
MTLRLILEYARPYAFPLIVATILMLGQSAAVLAMPWLFGYLSEAIFTDIDFEIGWIALALIVLFALQASFQIIRSFMLTDISERIISDLRILTYAHVQSLPMSFHLQRRRGDLISAVTYETERLSGFLLGPALGFLPQLMTLVGALSLMVHFDPVLAIPIAMAIPVMALSAKLLGRRFRSVSAEYTHTLVQVLNTLESNLSMLPAIKSFVREPEVLEYYRRRVNELKQISTKMAKRQALLSPLVLFVTASGIVLVLWTSHSRLSAGYLGVREFVSFLLYAALLTRPVGQMANLWGQYQLAMGALENLNVILATEPEPHMAGEVPDAVAGDIEFKRVSFAHAAREPVFRDLNLRIPAGQTIALTGENGAGKTTLIELLLRFHEPQGGSVLLDGVDVEHLQLRALRNAIGVVPQIAYLFEGTVRENILFGNPEADDTAINVAVERAQATELVRKLPKGLQTMIGDKGVKLSGGERQRLALARALIKDPPILVLDEPTAMFDPSGEAAFVDAAHAIFADKTVIIITHRPASLALVDRVVVLGEGGVVKDSVRRGSLQSPSITSAASTGAGR